MNERGSVFADVIVSIAIISVFMVTVFPLVQDMFAYQEVKMEIGAYHDSVREHLNTLKTANEATIDSLSTVVIHSNPEISCDHVTSLQPSGLKRTVATCSFPVDKGNFEQNFVIERSF